MKLFFTLITLFLCYPNFTYGFHDNGPKNLLISQDIKNVSIVDTQEEPMNVGMIVSQAIKNKSQLIFCDYLNLYLMDLNTGYTKILEKPKNVDTWVPTGVKWCSENQLLYLANYLGKDILILKFDDQDQLSLVKRYTDEELIGPENIDVIDKGQLVVAADFDASKVILFNESGKLWSYKVGNAHGVSFSKDKKFIYVSGLSPAKLYKFDLKGNLIKETGEYGWGANNYFWPTSIAVTDKNVLVSDAHAGKISFLDEDLTFQKSIGGNGLGITLFNMPYGVMMNKGFLFVTDTFKGRILQIDPNENKIISIYYTDNFFGSKTNVINDKFDKDSKWISETQEPLGRTYKEKERINLGQDINIHFNEFGLNVSWSPAYNGFNYKQLVKLSLNRSGLFSGLTYYWVLAKNFEYKNASCAIIGSPEVAEWLFLYKGIVYPIRVGIDFWIKNNSLASSRGQVLSFEALASIAVPKIESYIESLKLGVKPLDAIVELLELSSVSDLSSRLSIAFPSKKGTEFLNGLINAQTTQEQQKIAKLFLKNVEKDDLLYFNELVIASMVVYGFVDN